MASREILREEHACISNCIFKHWANTKPEEDLSKIDAKYQKCLDDCRICA